MQSSNNKNIKSQNNKKVKKQQHKSKIETNFYKPKKVKKDSIVDDEKLDKLLDSDSEIADLKEKTNQKSLKINKQNNEDSEDDSENSQGLVNDYEIQNEIITEQEILEQEIQNLTGAWNDEDDLHIKVDISKVARLRKLRNHLDETEISGMEYQRRLKKFYTEKLNSSSFYAWACQDKEFQSDSEFENDDDEENNVHKEALMEKLLKQDYSTLKNFDELENLPQDIVSMEKYATVRHQDKHDAVIQSIDFHHNSQIFLTSGLDKLVKIYNVRDQKQQYRDKIKLVKSIYLENLPIENAQFLSGRGEVLASGLKKHLLCVDLQKDSIEKISSHLFTSRFEKKLGKFVLSSDEKYIALCNRGGYFVMILCGKTKQFLYEIKVTEAVASADFSYDGQYIFILGLSGSIFQYCLKTRQIFDVIQDESVNANIIKCSKNQLVTGSQSGIVNVYVQNQADHTIIPKPIKELQNLTTEISTLAFNPANEMLFTGSRWKKNAARIAHMPSYTVFQNWPNFKTNFGFVSSVDFSEDNKFLALGNTSGQVSLYNFAHYNNNNQILV